MADTPDPPTPPADTPAAYRSAKPVRALSAATAVAVFAPMIAQYLLIAAGRTALPAGWDAFAAVASAASYASALGMVIALIALLSLAARPTGKLTIEKSDFVFRPRAGEPRDISRDAIRSGVMVPSGETYRVDLHARNGDLLMAWVPTVAHGESVLSAAGVGAAQQRLRASLGARSNRVIGGVVSGVLSLAVTTFAAGAIEHDIAGGVVFAAWAVLNVAAVWTLMRMFRPPQITVGADGVAIRVSFWNHFVPVSALASVHATPDSYLVIRTRDGRTRRYFASVKREALATVALRIQSAIDLHASRGTAPEPLVALERAGRPLPEWRSALRSLARSATSYREAHFGRDDVLRVLDDPTAPPSRRLGAAIALTEAGDTEAAQRIRVAAEACANEPVRVALERVLDGNLDAMTIDQLESADLARRGVR